jgi:uncharacterized membrane protein YfcA
MTWELLGYAGAVLMGLSLGIFGGGGSTLTVPILVYLFHQDPVTATGLSLLLVGTTSGAGLFAHHRQGNIDWRSAAVFGAASLVSVFITRRWLLPALPDPIFRFGPVAVSKGVFILGLFAVMMIASARRMIRKPKAERDGPERKRHLLQLLPIGLAVGLLTGILGAGGGFLIVPALVLLAGMDVKRAVGTSLFIITANSFIGFLGDREVRVMDHAHLLVPFLALAILGILIGSRAAKRIHPEKLRPAFGWFLAAMGAFIIVRELYTLA